MKTNADNKQMRLSAQIALALTLGTAFVPTTVCAAPITAPQTYATSTTVTEDVDISGGTIAVEGVNDDSTGQHENRTVELKGSNIKILNPTGSVLTALSRGDGTMDFSGVLTVNPDRTGKVELHGDILVDRRDNSNSSTSYRGGYVKLYLKGADSYFAGGITEVKDVGNNVIPLHKRGGVLLDLSRGATWYPKGDAYTLFNPDDPSEKFSFKPDWSEDQSKPVGFHLSANGGIIDMAFAAPNTLRTAAVGQRTLTFDNARAALNGATFRISTDLTHNRADKIVLNGVTGTSNQYKLQIGFDPKMNDAANKTNYEFTPSAPGGIPVLDSDNTGDTVTAREYTAKKAVAAGLLTKNFKIEPTVVEATESGRKIVRVTKVKITDVNPTPPPTPPTPPPTPPTPPPTPPTPPPTPPTPPPTPPTPPPTPTPPTPGPALRTADLLMDMALAQLSAWRGENNDLHRRMGGLRAGGASGAWVRGYGGRTEFGSYPTEGRYSGVQVGIDRAASLHGGTLFMGVAASTSSGTARNSDLDGSHRAHFFGVYGSYMGKRGDYLDAIVKYGRMTNDATAVFDGTAYTGGYGVNGWNISVEYGHRIAITPHFYWTPQVELNYGRIGAADYTMRAGSLSGAHIANDAVTTLVGRIGTQIGCEDEHGTVYLKLGYLREFKGDLHMRAQYGSTSIDRSYTARDSYFEYGVGFARRVGRADIYGELSRTAGADAIREKWKANLGVRIEL
ncbi:autotransporter outer membrane beta-barrel domain-containing protein [uncultured Selenomonas sp.]|uniref:autotransporter outer membrane beta-barrel domain-containing protein n=1 Tax=uncultured Selenomonas sp. TaxID=159275 RepID=UPI0028DB2320|nr:autotransporter outer membrane beta-barrel domain-containing protein [uncultured Selenomonas sp.]